MNAVADPTGLLEHHMPGLQSISQNKGDRRAAALESCRMVGNMRPTAVVSQRRFLGG